MGTLTGSVTNIVGGELTAARIVLVPEEDVAGLGSLELDDTFSVTVPDGTYSIVIRFYDPPSRGIAMVRTSPFEISGATTLDVLNLALLTGPVTTAFALDTDGRYYYDPTGAGTHSVFLDTDGNPYFDIGGGGEDVYQDVDGVPVILTAT